MTQQPTLKLAGTWRNPQLLATFAPYDRHPARPNRTLLDFIKSLPGRRFDKANLRWIITGVGTDPVGKFTRAGFTLDTSDPAADFTGFSSLADLEELVAPVTHLTQTADELFIRPRLTGYEIVAEMLAHTAAWDAKREMFRLPIGDLIQDGQPIAGLPVSDAAIAAAWASHEITGTPDEIRAAAAELAAATSITEAAEDHAAVTAHLGTDIPDWFGLDLFPYQRSGALAAAAGHSFIADEPGLGKTRQALAAAAMLAPERILVVAPPVALTNWAKQAAESGVPAAAELCAQMGPPAGGDVTATSALPTAQAGHLAASILTGDGEFTPTGGYTAAGSTPGETGVVAIAPGRKTPQLPQSGCVVVADSTLASRPALVSELIDWAPDVLIDDEIHRHKNPAAQRTRAVLKLAAATTRQVIGLSGTPMLKNPDQLASQLDITGHLYPIFGSYRAFMHTYCRRQEFNGYATWKPRKKALPQLGRSLATGVWVRRTKDEVLPDLPKKLRRLIWVDINLRAYQQAHEEVLGQIADTAEDFSETTGRWPKTGRELLDIAGDPFTVLAPLRKAAGMAKVSAAADWISEHLEAAGDRAPFDRPLIVWTHHRDVAEGLSAAVAEAHPDTPVAAILGGMSRSTRDEVVADFQAGRTGVLIASITAANVAITLTRSCDVLFVEADWNPASISQAEDRAARIGQDRPVTVTTLAAADTIDERMHKALQDTAKTLAPVLVDGDNAVSTAHQSSVKSATELLRDLAARAVDGRKRRLARLNAETRQTVNA